MPCFSGLSLKSRSPDFLHTQLLMRVDALQRTAAPASQCNFNWSIAGAQSQKGITYRKSCWKEIVCSTFVPALAPTANLVHTATCTCARGRDDLLSSVISRLQHSGRSQIHSSIK
eukprot:s914_g2.t1